MSDKPVITRGADPSVLRAQTIEGDFYASSAQAFSSVIVPQWLNVSGNTPELELNIAINMAYQELRRCELAKRNVPTAAELKARFEGVRAPK